MSEDENHENRSGWAYKAQNGAVVQVLTHYVESVAEFNMYNWAWANYQEVTGQNHETLTSFDNAAALPNRAQLRGVTNAGNAFINCWNLTDLSPFGNLTAYGNGVEFFRMFYNCQNLTTLEPLANWDTSNVTNMYVTFNRCNSLTSLDGIANWDVSNVTNMTSTFHYCSNLSTLDGIANWDVSNVKILMSMFSSCSNLSTLDGIANWNVAELRVMEKAFNNCSNLTCAVIPETLASTMNCSIIDAFRNCTNLQGDIYFYGNNINNATNCFNGCNAYEKNIHAYAGSRTWNSFYSAMGNSTYNSAWNAYLYEM